MRPNARTFRQKASRAALQLGNIVRRVVVSASDGGLWAIAGYAVPDLRGGDGVSIEGEGDEPLEVFGGNLIYARPAAGDDAEALVLNVGAEADHPVIAAVRNEAARQRYVAEFGDIEQGECVIFPSAGKSRVIVKIDGSIEITVEDGKQLLVRTKDGVVDSLVKKSEYDAHLHPTALGASSAPTVPAMGTVIQSE